MSKLDPWDNPYYILFDATPRNTYSSKAFITVISAGPNGKADIGGAVDEDDIFLICQYTNGEVITHAYSMASDAEDASGHALTVGFTKLFFARETAPVNKFSRTLSYGSGSGSTGTVSSGGSSGSSGGSSRLPRLALPLQLTSRGAQPSFHRDNAHGSHLYYPASSVMANYTETMSVIAHDYTAVRTEATCTAEGKIKYTCSLCGDIGLSEVIPIAAHKHHKIFQGQDEAGRTARFRSCMRTTPLVRSQMNATK